MKLWLDNMSPLQLGAYCPELDVSDWTLEDGSKQRLPPSLDAYAAILLDGDEPSEPLRLRLRPYLRLRTRPPLIALIRTHAALGGLLHEGLDDFVLVPFRAEELCLRIQARSRQVVLKLGRCEVWLNAQEARWPERTVPLTATEVRLLSHLLSARERPISREELLREAWGYQVAVDTRAVALTVSRLRKKIEADAEVPTHLLTAYGIGYRLVLSPHESAGMSGRAFGLPMVHSRLFGREALVQQALSALETGAQILVLTGTGGIGKTRVALAIGAQRPKDWEAVYWDFSSTTAAEEPALTSDLLEADVLGCLSRCLEVRPQGETATMSEVARVLRSRRILILLDNLDGPVAEAARTLEQLLTLLQPGAELRLVVTSRRRLPTALAVHSEIPPLSAEEGRALFIDRVESQNPRHVWGDEDFAILLTLVERLDGLPLAIELAAGRASVLSPREIHQRLQSRFALLGQPESGSGERKPVRHRSLQQTLDDSWELLSPSLQLALQTCAVFQGGFTAEAAEALMPDDPDSALDRLQTLIDHSLIQRRQGGGETRCYLFESVQAYLLAKGIGAEPRARHFLHYRQVAAQLAQDALGLELQSSLVRFEEERPNLLSALRYVCEKTAEEALPLAIDLCQLAWIQGDPQGLTLLDMIPLPRDPLQLCQLKVQRARFLQRVSRLAEARALCQEVEAAGESVAGLEYWLHALQLLSIIDLQEGRADSALERQERVVRILTDRGITRWKALNLIKRADCYRRLGRMREARSSLAEALELTRQEGARWHELLVLGHLSLVHHQLGELDQAIAHMEPWLHFMQVSQNERSALQGLLNLAIFQIDAARPADAEATLEQSARLVERLGSVSERLFWACARARLAIERNHLAEAEMAVSQGLALGADGGLRLISHAWALRGWIHHLHGQLERAAVCLERASAPYADIQNSPEAGKLLLHLARIRADQGALEEAQELFGRAVFSLTPSEQPSTEALVGLTAAHLCCYGLGVALPGGSIPLATAEARAALADGAGSAEARWLLRVFPSSLPVGAGALIQP